MKHAQRIAVLALLAPLALAVGCGESKYAIDVHYSRPAQEQIPEQVQVIAVSPFGGPTAEDRAWGEVASDKLAARLAEENRRYNRYTLIDQKHIKDMLDQADLNLALSGTSEAANQVGRRLNAQAIVYGTVQANCETREEQRTVIDPLGRGTRTVTEPRRTCVVNATFSLNDINTSRTLFTYHPANLRYDSNDEKDGGFGGMASGALGFGGGSSLPSEAEIIDRLLTQAVNEFIARISPHDATYTIPLEKGKSDMVERGNKLAVVGDYQEALGLYLEALSAKPDDDGAAFNAGAMYEAMGQLQQAAEYYERAFRLKDKEKYLEARQRVRAELQTAPTA